MITTIVLWAYLVIGAGCARLAFWLDREAGRGHSVFSAPFYVVVCGVLWPFALVVGAVEALVMKRTAAKVLAALFLAGCSSSSTPAPSPELAPRDDAGAPDATVAADDAGAELDATRPPFDAELPDVVRLDVAIPDAGVDVAPEDAGPSCAPFYASLSDGGLSWHFADGGAAPNATCSQDAGEPYPFVCSGGGAVVQTNCAAADVTGITCCACTPDPAGPKATCEALDAGVPVPWGCWFGAPAPISCIATNSGGNPEYCCPRSTY